MINILIGNGVDIQFSGNDDYKNWAIIERLRKNIAEPNRYSNRFNGSLKADDIKNLLDDLHKWFTEKATKGVDYLKYLKNEDDANTFCGIIKRYNKKSPDVLSIGIEDYLFILKFFNESTEMNDIEYDNLYQAITSLFADAIYNDGKIEEIYHNMDKLKDFIEDFDMIFTVNYDRNIDKLANSKVYHLHGTLDTLHHEYREDTYKGYAMKVCGKSLNTYIKGKEYLYSDALFGYSGKNKLDRIMQYNQPYYDPRTEKFRNAHPELDCPRYPIDEFKAIEGELHIVGLSPNNDSHIFDMVNQNKTISKVFYYFASKDDENRAKKIIKKPIETADVFRLWQSLGV